MACAGDARFQPGESVYLALDLSNTLDLSALLMGSTDDVARVQPFFWKPADALIEQSFRDFGSGNYRYLEWQKAGHIATTPGKSIDKAVIARRIAELCGIYNVRALAYDRWRVDELLREFDRIGFTAYKVEGEIDDGKINKQTRDGLRMQPGARFQGHGPGDRRLRGGGGRAQTDPPQQSVPQLEHGKRDRRHEPAGAESSTRKNPTSASTARWRSRC